MALQLTLYLHRSISSVIARYSEWFSKSSAISYSLPATAFVIEIAKALFGDKASHDGLEHSGVTADGDVVFLSAFGVSQDDVPVAELLVVELVFLEFDALEGARDGPE